jgi:hypothetical protein
MVVKKHLRTRKNIQKGGGNEALRQGLSNANAAADYSNPSTSPVMTLDEFRKKINEFGADYKDVKDIHPHNVGFFTSRSRFGFGSERVPVLTDDNGIPLTQQIRSENGTTYEINIPLFKVGDNYYISKTVYNKQNKQYLTGSEYYTKPKFGFKQLFKYVARPVTSFIDSVATNAARGAYYGGTRGYKLMGKGFFGGLTSFVTGAAGLGVGAAVGGVKGYYQSTVGGLVNKIRNLRSRKNFFNPLSSNFRSHKVHEHLKLLQSENELKYNTRKGSSFARYVNGIRPINYNGSPIKPARQNQKFASQDPKLGK